MFKPKTPIVAFSFTSSVKLEPVLQNWFKFCKKTKNLLLNNFLLTNY